MGQLANIDDWDENYLQHFGVKGMKWGVRRNRDSASPRAPKAAKPSSSEIMDARLKVESRGRLLNQAAAKANVSGSKKDQITYKKMLDDYNRDPAQSVAQRMTKGEKVSAAVLTVAGGVVLGAPGAIAVGGAMGGVAAVNRHNRRQFDKYRETDKPKFN